MFCCWRGTAPPHHTHPSRGPAPSSKWCAKHIAVRKALSTQVLCQPCTCCCLAAPAAATNSVSSATAMLGQHACCHVVMCMYCTLCCMPGTGIHAAWHMDACCTQPAPLSCDPLPFPSPPRPMSAAPGLGALTAPDGSPCVWCLLATCPECAAHLPRTQRMTPLPFSCWAPAAV